MTRLRPPSSLITAGIIALVVILWMLSGLFDADRPGDAAGQEPADSEAAPTVEVRPSSARSVTRYLTSQGQTEAERLVTVTAEIRGRVTELAAEEGTRVAGDALLARLAMEDRQARRKEAQARVKQRASELEAAEQLGESGYQARVQVEEAEAALAAARARLAAVREEIADTAIRAPFDGFLERYHTEVGAFVTPGGAIARLADLDPLVVSAPVPQQRIGEVAEGVEAQVRLADGRQRTGRVRYIGRTAAEATRTFRVEVAVPNPEGQVRAGVSAEVRIPVGEANAHFVSPGLLTLNSAGDLGIKTVNAEDRAVFHAVEVVRTEPDGAWVTGLPDEVRLITVGQGFAHDGDRVRPVPAGGQAGGPAADPLVLEPAS